LLVLAPFTALLGGFTLQRVFRRRVAACGVVDVAGFAAWIAATAIGPVATASVLAAQTGTMSAVFGTTVLHERPTRVPIAGITATVVAVTLLALSEAV
jgi:drug/metabolite transporter (DMT)-like permease